MKPNTTHAINQVMGIELPNDNRFNEARLDPILNEVSSFNLCLGSQITELRTVIFKVTHFKLINLSLTEIYVIEYVAQNSCMLNAHPCYIIK